MAPKVVYGGPSMSDARQSFNTAFWNGNFAKVDRMYEEILDGKIRTTDGSWLVEAIQQALDNIGSAGPKVLDPALERWAQVSPHSRLRPLAVAIVWQRRAWEERGGGHSGSVTNESMQIFREDLAKSWKALQDAPQAKESPLWYWTALVVAGSSGQSPQDLNALFHEATTRFPTYQTIYYTRMNYLLPQWGGSYELVSDFIDASVAATRAQDGDSFYAWLYLDLARRNHDDVFTDMHASWPRLKAAFDDLVSRYPDLRNKVAYATFACQVRDKETTSRLLIELGGKGELGGWRPQVSTEGCRRLVSEPA